ncbi:FtsW/RodA/SpoVE family cell cycle protein, partial [Streptomyces zhihengii]
FFIVAVFFLRDHRVLQRYTYVSVVSALALLVLPIFFPAVNGARIWIRIAGFSIQPGEFAKVLLAVFFAAYLAANRNALAYSGRQIWRFRRLQLPTGRVLGPIVAIWLLSVVVLILERDLGTSLLFFGLFVIMLYVATERTSWIVFGLLMSAAGAVGVATFEPHVQQRVQAWLNPMGEYKLSQSGAPGVHSEQAMQALWAFGSGGTLGTGLGQGHSELIRFAGTLSGRPAHRTGHQGDPRRPRQHRGERCDRQWAHGGAAHPAGAPAHLPLRQTARSEEGPVAAPNLRQRRRRTGQYRRHYRPRQGVTRAAPQESPAPCRLPFAASAGSRRAEPTRLPRFPRGPGATTRRPCPSSPT